MHAEQVPVMLAAATSAGWVDAVDPYSGNVFAKDNNWFKQQVMRVSLLWKPTERSAITTSVYAANEVQNDDSGWTKDVPSAASLLSDPVLGPGLSALAAQGWGGLQTRCNAVPASPSARVASAIAACVHFAAEPCSPRASAWPSRRWARNSSGVAAAGTSVQVRPMSTPAWSSEPPIPVPPRVST